MILVDKKDMYDGGYQVAFSKTNSEKCYIEGKNFVNLIITHDTSITQRTGEIRKVFKLTVETGEIYEIELVSYVAVPNLSLTSSILDFEKVYIGRKKKMYFKIENITKVEVEWSVRNMNNQSKKTEMKFLKLSELNSSKEIEKIDINIEEVAVFTPVAKDDVIKFDSKSINIDNIPQIVEIYEDSKTEKENVKNINFTENDSVTEEIKIEKIEIEPITNQSVTNIENNVTPIVNMIKAETVFNKIQDSERESTEFNDRK